MRSWNLSNMGPALPQRFSGEDGACGAEHDRRRARQETDPQPPGEWEVVAAEPTTIGQIYASYALPLALIPAVAGFVGASLVGMGVPGLGNFRVPLGLGLVSAAGPARDRSSRSSMSWR
jgi:hypothetical protein